jgi:hypothetical protein
MCNPSRSGDARKHTMPQIIDPIPSSSEDGRILCCYVNATSSIQVVRVTDVPGWYFERVAFPGQRLIFEAIALAHLEVHTGMMASSILSDTIPCSELAMVLEESPVPFAAGLDMSIPMIVNAPSKVGASSGNTSPVNACAS